MAIDTRQKRMSAIHVVSPWRGPMVAPTGSASQAIRQAAAFMYSGIASGAPVIDVPDDGDNGWIVRLRNRGFIVSRRIDGYIKD